ncbi:MAG: PqqD family protein [Caldilinea sp.]|nr:PqqD family protein [Caldilineaceae bacterium]MCO5212649.1 PqqD family protein [Caldilinea sp.]
MVQQSQQAAGQVLYGQAVILLPVRGETLVLNASATLLWTVMAAPVGPAALAAHLQTHYGVSERRALTDTHAFLDALHAAGAIEGWSA